MEIEERYSAKNRRAVVYSGSKMTYYQHVLLVTWTFVVLTLADKGCVELKLEADSPSVFFLTPQGRLGNQMLGYAIQLQLKKLLGIQPVVHRECKAYLSKIFSQETLTIPALEDHFCNFRDLQFTMFDGSFRDLISNKAYRRGHLLWLYPPSGDRNVGGYGPEDPDFNDQFEVDYEKTLASTVKIKPKFLKKAEKILQSVQKERRKNGKPKIETFVGIHNRRGDHLQFMQERLQRKPLGIDFFKTAIEKFR